MIIADWLVHNTGILRFLLRSDGTKVICSSLLYSEGVFKCPEDQLPLDYAKVTHSPPRSLSSQGNK